MGESEKEQFYDWLRQFVEKPNAFTGGLAVCPFAKEARVKNNISFQLIHNPAELFAELEKQIHRFLVQPEKVYVAASLKVAELPLDVVREAVLQLREKYFSRNAWLLYDHPRSKEPMDSGHQFNQGNLVLFFIQPLSALVEAAQVLKERGYYDQWEPTYYREVVELREQYYQRYLALKRKNLEHSLETLME